jgi:hypothetical protein
VASVIVFDVIETLLDLRPLQEPFVRAFGDPAPLGEWFARLLHGSLVATVTSTYEDFGTIGRREEDASGRRTIAALSEPPPGGYRGSQSRSLGGGAVLLSPQRLFSGWCAEGASS